MTNSIFVNIPVCDLAAAMAYYKALGFDRNPQFTDRGLHRREVIYVL
ncbi:MAG: hypothetical protein MO852_04905 [Candidatus Devosia euplotis]|nr:hypothetical protein [Candidatus Devosia euplotis]